MRATLEYITAALILFVIFMVILPNIASITRNMARGLESTSIDETAYSTYQLLSKSPGKPENWGHVAQVTSTQYRVVDPNSIGLALKGYEAALDPEKVSYLVLNNENASLRYELIKDLGLEGKYAIQVKISKIFDITISELDVNKFGVSIVSRLSGMPIQGANVSGYLICLNETTGSLRSYEELNVTNAAGYCTLTFSEAPQNSEQLLIVIADYFGLKSWALKTSRELLAIDGGLMDDMAFSIALPQTLSIEQLSNKIAIVTCSGITLLDKEAVVDQLNCTLTIRSKTYNAIKLMQSGIEILGVIAGVYDGEWQLLIAWRLPINTPQWVIGSTSSYSQYSSTIRGIIELSKCHYILEVTLEGGYRK